MDTSVQLTRRDMLSQFIGSASESHIAAVLPHVKSRASGRDEYPLLIIIAPLNKPETWQKSWSVGQARTYYKTTIQEYFTHTYSTKRRQKETIFQKILWTDRWKEERTDSPTQQGVGSLLRDLK